MYSKPKQTYNNDYVETVVV